MKYHKEQCEVCENSRPKPLNHVTFVCLADTGSKWGKGDVVSKKNVAKRKCRYFKKEEVGEEEATP